VLANNINRLLHATAFGHHVFDDDDFFAGGNLESAPQSKPAILFFRKNEPDTELPHDFLADDQPAERERDDDDDAKGFRFNRQCAAGLFDDGHLLKRKRALEILPAVQAAAG